MYALLVVENFRTYFVFGYMYLILGGLLHIIKVQSCSVLLTPPLSGRWFFPRLVEYMSSGPLVALLLGREEAVQRWRELIGPTCPHEASQLHPLSLRGQFGLSGTANSLHGSGDL